MVTAWLAGLLIISTSPAQSALALPEMPVNGEFGTIPLPDVLPRAADDNPDMLFGPDEDLAPPPAPRPALPSPLPFAVGEHLKFSIGYGIINAGGAVMEVAGERRVMGRPCFDIRTEARSNGFFSKIYKVWDRAQSFVDQETVLPWRFEKHLREGGYHKDLTIKFDRKNNCVKYKNGEEVSTSAWTQDELSAFYYLRTLPLEVGQDVFIDNHSNRKNYPLKVIVHRRETIKVDAGEFDCWVIEPVIREGGIFSAKGTLTIWLTADDRRMPVQMKTKIMVGSITASLKEYRLGESGAKLTARIGG